MDGHSSFFLNTENRLPVLFSECNSDHIFYCIFENIVKSIERIFLVFQDKKNTVSYTLTLRHDSKLLDTMYILHFKTCVTHLFSSEIHFNFIVVSVTLSSYACC